MHFVSQVELKKYMCQHMGFCAYISDIGSWFKPWRPDGHNIHAYIHIYICINLADTEAYVILIYMAMPTRSPETGDRLETWSAINSPNSLVKCLVQREMQIANVLWGAMSVKEASKGKTC